MLSNFRATVIFSCSDNPKFLAWKMELGLFRLRSVRLINLCLIIWDNYTLKQIFFLSGQMYCSHPGSPTSGFIDPNNYIYEIGTTVQVGCNSGLKLQGRKWLTCQQDGSWSSTIGLCISDFWPSHWVTLFF
jgi:hypothetical protein